ncbi:MAG: DNA polymerase III subunit delta [Clostridia bacterium]|nr:DNA polymerase III subunit delta [Clostridia bacterium]MDE7328299.1 DNA polymerase III subunit delta [Clostridia bacterium]
MQAIQLKQTFKTNVSDIYAITGDDEGLILYALEKFYDLIPSDTRDYCVQKFEGNEVNSADVISSLAYNSMFGDRRLVIVKDVNRKLSTQEIESWLDYVENINDGNVLILVNSPSIKSAISEFAVEVDCNRMSLIDYTNYIETLFKFYKIKYDRTALSEIVNRCNKDFGKINNELNKIMLYASTETLVDRELIRELVPIDTETQVFEFVYALQDGDFDRAMGIIDILLERGDKPSMILATLTMTYKRTFAIMTNDGDDDFLSESLGMKKSALFMARKKIDAAKRRTSGFLARLKNTVYYLYGLEYDFKSGKITQENALDLAITYLIGKTNAKRT